MTDTVFVSIAVVLRILANPSANVFQKLLTGKGNHPLIVNFLTYLLLSVVCLLFAGSVNWHEMPQQFWFYSVLVGIAGALGNGFLVKALQKGELSVLGPVNSYKSVIGIIGGIILLGEIPNIWGLLGVVLIIFGSYFVLDTTEERFSFAILKRKDIQFRLLALILTAIEAVFIKKVILASSATIAFISWCCFGALFSLVLLFVYRLDLKKELLKTDFRELTGFAFLVVFIGTMQFTTNYVFAHMDVGYALSLFQLSIIVSVFLGHRIFKEQDISKKLIGSAIMIIGSAVIIIMGKNFH
jgi:drug/metabolite transporter (DMT)-like permease